MAATEGVVYKLGIVQGEGLLMRDMIWREGYKINRAGMTRAECAAVG